jgi:hypothetical protein
LLKLPFGNLTLSKEEENEPPQLDWSRQPNNGIQPQRICSSRDLPELFQGKKSRIREEDGGVNN